MKSLLFHAPRSDPDDDEGWSRFLGEASLWLLPDGADQLAPNVWLLPARGNAYLELARLCRQHSIAPRCLEIAHAAGWNRLP
jgi:hypothetical protein